MKWNWGTKIFLVYSGFVVAMLTMVYLCTQQHYDLVTPDYYAQELQYQQIIDGQNNTRALGKAMTVSMQQNDVLVELPTTSANSEAAVKFYRPDNASLDFSVALNETGKVMVPASKLKPGMYKVKASWKHDGKSFYDEQAYVAK